MLQPLTCNPPQKAPYWLFDTSGQWTNKHLVPCIRHVCDIVADLSALHKSIVRTETASGHSCWEVTFSVNVYFGQTALSAEMCWTADVCSLP